ncbi:MAG: dihydrofolate reductase [Deltaproteobacteria bacterium]
MRVSLIVAAAENNVIGKDGALPWRLPDDLKHFKALTRGHHIVMGRRTWESIGRVLPERVSIVLSRQPALALEGAHVVAGIGAALALAEAAGEDEAFVIGGAAVYAAALPRTDRIHLTRVHATIEGDTGLPAWPAEQFVETSAEMHPADEKHPYSFSFIELNRIG